MPRTFRDGAAAAAAGAVAERVGVRGGADAGGFSQSAGEALGFPGWIACLGSAIGFLRFGKV